MRRRFTMTVAIVLLAVCVVLASAGVETTTAIEAAGATTSTTVTPVALGPRSTAPLASDFCLIAPLRNASCSSGTIRFFYNSQHNACDVMTDACFGSLNVFDTITACQTACVQHYCNSTSDCSMGQSCSKPGCGTKRTCVPGLATYSACDPNSCTPCKSNDTCYLNYRHVSTCCPAITCPTSCPYGRRLDRYGCPRCDCLGSPCEGMMCASGMRCFNVAQRETWRAVCVNASTLVSNMSSVACNTDENIDKWLTDNSATYNRYGDPLAAVYSQLPSCRLCYVRMRHPTRPWCNTAVSPIDFGNGTTNVTDDGDSSHHHTSDFDLTSDDVDDDDYNQPTSVKNRTACTSDSDCSSLQYCSRSLYCAHFRKYGESCDGDDRCTDGNECLHTITASGVCCKPSTCTTVCMYGLVSDTSGCPKCACRSNPCLPNPCSNGSRCQAGQSGLYSCLLNSTSTIGPLLLSPVDTKSTSILRMARWLMSYLNPPGTQCQVFLLRVTNAAISMIAGSMYELDVDVASAVSCTRPNKKNIIIPQSQAIDPDSYQAVSATLLNQQGLYSLISLQVSANISAIPTPDYSYFDTDSEQDTVNPTSNSNSTASSAANGRFIRIVLPVVATVGLFSIGLVAVAIVVTRHSRREGMSIQEFTTTIEEDDEEYLEWEDDMSSQNGLVNSTSANSSTV